MKKLLALLLALTMLITAGTVFAETGGTPDLYDLYDPTGNGRTWVGTAIPITDGVAITSPIGMPETVKDLEDPVHRGRKGPGAAARDRRGKARDSGF